MISQYITSRRWLDPLCILGALFAGVVIGRMVVLGQHTLVLFAVVIIPVAVLVLSNPRAALVLIILGVFSFEYLVGQGILPTMGLWAVDGLVLLLFTRVFIVEKQTSGLFFRGATFKLLVVWAIAVICSAAVNGSSPIQIVLGMRVYVRFALLYFCLLEFDWDEKFLARCLLLVTSLFMLQVPVALVQKAAGLGIDSVAGTIASSGGTGTLSIDAMGFFAGWTAYAVFAQQLLPLLFGVSVLVLPALATARAFILVIPVVAIYTFLRLAPYRPARHLGIVLLGVGLVILNWTAIQGSHVSGGFQAIDIIRNPLLYLDELSLGPVEGTTGSSIGKIAAMQLTWSQISQSWPTLLLGFGPATAQGSRFSALQSELFESLALAGGRASQLNRSLMEWGLLGTLAYASIYVLAWFQANKAVRSLQEPFWKAVAFSYSVIALLCLFLSVYGATWSATSTTFFFWLTGGILQRVSHVRTVQAGSLPEMSG